MVRNAWKSSTSVKIMRIYKIYEIQWKSSEDKKPAWNRAKIFIKAAARLLRPSGIQSMKMYKIECKSSEDNKPFWNRANVSMGAKARLSRPLNIQAPKSMNVYENQKNQLKSTKNMNPSKSMQYDEIPQRTRSQPGIEQRFLWGQQLESWGCHAQKSMRINETQCKSMKINKIRWKSSGNKKPAWNWAKLSIGAAGLTIKNLSLIEHAKC